MTSLSDSESQSEDTDHSFSPPYQQQQQQPYSYNMSTGSKRQYNTTQSTSASGSDSDAYNVGLPNTSDDEVYTPAKRTKSTSEDSCFAGFGMGGNNNVFNPDHGNSVAQDFITKTGNDNLGGGYSNAAAKMMEKMGHKKGTGLGRHGQGIVEPVSSSNQKGRRGLGLEIKGFEVSEIGWDYEKEKVITEESVDWLPECKAAVPDYTEMLSWIRVESKKMVIDDEDEFISSDTLTNVLKCKSIFDTLESKEMMRARTKSNPYETIRGVFFQNRAAMKMANMDAVLDFMFTQPKDEQGRPMLDRNDILYFADVCAGPGGFSEYVLWRKGVDVKGFGFTLKGDCDFKLSEFFAAPSEFFEPHYGKNNDGDIYAPENQDCFRQFVMDSTDQTGVHFMMADGGFSVEGQENLQEICSKRLYLCQFTVALSILRPGGNFVCKLFDLFTPFSVGLVYLMYRAFRRVCIYKPITSRPANSERYIVCHGLRSDSEAIHQYMYELNCKLAHFTSLGDTDDIREVVPLSLLKEDDTFFNYIYNSNEIIGRAQAISLVKIQTFAKNPNLHEGRQSEVREQCLDKWKVPNKVREIPDRGLQIVPNVFSKLFNDSERDYLKLKPTEIDNASLQKLGVYNYRCVVSGASERWILLALGSSYVYQLQEGFRWKQVSDVKLELPAKTLIEVEYVQELRGESRGQRRIMAVHIIDGLVLAGNDIRHMHYNERIATLKRFVKVITRPTRVELSPIRVKDVYRFESMAEIFERLEIHTMKGVGQQRRICYTCQPLHNQEDMPEIYHIPTGILFIRIIAEPWVMAISKSQNRKYLFNTSNGNSRFDTIAESIASHKESKKKSLVWSWLPGVKYHDNQDDDESENRVSKDSILDFIHTHV